jgi:MSHA pilin protein MshD
MKIQNSKSKEVSVISVCVRKKLTLLTDTIARKSGFSLIEIVMIIVVVSIAIPALLIMVGQEAKFGIESEIRVTATNVAQQLMEAIRLKSWDQNMPIPPGTASSTLGPDGETTQADYNDVDDFNKLDPSASGCTDTVSVNNVSFTRAVDVCYVADGALNTCLGSKSGCTWSGGATPTDYKKITVTITAPGTNWNSSVTLTTVVTNY